VVSWKPYKIGPRLLWNVSQRYPIDLCQFRWPWVTLKGGTRGSASLPANLHRYARIVWQTAIRFVTVIHVVDRRVCKWSGMPPTWGRNPERSNFGGIPLVMPTCTLWRRRTKIGVVTPRECFMRSAKAPIPRGGPPVVLYNFWYALY